MYHYTESGLDNVWLMNGVEHHKTDYGDAISFKNLDGLHRAVGAWLISLPKRLNGAELRFLRTEMDLSQKRLTALLGVEEQALRRWEKYRGRPIPGAADRLLRIVYADHVGYHAPIHDIVERLAKLDEIEGAEARLKVSKGNWRIAA
jgi:DNA-binding transcriptional regulator YiaG